MMKHTHTQIPLSDSAVSIIAIYCIRHLQRAALRSLLFLCILLSCNSFYANWSITPTTLDLPSPNASSPASLAVDTFGNVMAAWLEYPIDEGMTAVAAYYSMASGSWSTPTILDPDHMAATPPHLVVDLVGNVTATWLENISGSYVVQASRFDGTTWSSPVALNNGTQSPNAYSGMPPQMIIDTLGNVTVVWFEQQESNYAVQTARFSGGSWTTSPTTLNGSTPTAYQDITPQIVVDGDGNVTVVWIEQESSTYAVQAARFSSGSWTSSPVTLDSDTLDAYETATPRVIVDALNNVTVTWLEKRSSTIAVEAARFSAGAWSATVVLDGATENASGSAYTVVDTAGNVTAAWLENLEVGTVVQASRYLIDSDTWTDPELLEIFGAAAGAPRLVVDALGNVTCTWFEYVGGYAIQASRFSAGSWSSPVNLNNGIQSPNAYIFALQQMLVDTSNNVTVVWIEQPGSNYTVQAAHFSAGSWTTSPTTLDGITSNAFPAAPLMMIDTFNTITTIWLENTDSALAIEAARFAEGSWTEEVVLNNGTQIPAAHPYTTLGMIVDNNGNVTTTWVENTTGPLAVQVARFSEPLTLLPPENLAGSQQIRKFPTYVEYINVLTWDAPASGTTPASYRV